MNSSYRSSKCNSSSSVTHAYVTKNCPAKNVDRTRVPVNNIIRRYEHPQKRHKHERSISEKRPQGFLYRTHLSGSILVRSVHVVHHHRQVGHCTNVQTKFHQLTSRDAPRQLRLPHLIPVLPCGEVHQHRSLKIVKKKIN